MERIYMNRRTGEQRIHVEITSSEVSDLLDDLQVDPEHYDSTSGFLVILHGAEETFSPVVAEGRRDRAARTASGQQPETAVAYGDGKGRVYCQRCAPTVEAASVPLTVDHVDHWELCPSCGCHVVDVARETPAVGQPAETQATDPWTPANLHFLRFALGCAAAVMYSEDDFTDEDHAALDQLRAFAGPEPSGVKAAALDEAADEAERENHDCSSLARCQPCAVRTAVATKLRRMAEEARS